MHESLTLVLFWSRKPCANSKDDRGSPVGLTERNARTIHVVACVDRSGVSLGFAGLNVLCTRLSGLWRNWCAELNDTPELTFTAGFGSVLN